MTQATQPSAPRRKLRFNVPWIKVVGIITGTEWFGSPN
jgi:hypothetical protein